MLRILNLPRASAAPKLWNKKKSQRPRSPIFVFSLFLLAIILVLFFFTSIRNPLSIVSISRGSIGAQYSPCTALSPGEKFLFYAPHSGFSNQLSEFKNAILIAGILNRTLIVPPVLDHHAVALGSCPKFRVLEPKDIRLAAWNHMIELLRSGRYVSMGDIVDISALLSSSLLRAIDFRVFLSLFCGLDISFPSSLESTAKSNLFDSLKRCGSLFSGSDGSVGKCLYAINDDCRTTVWTYQEEHHDGRLDPFQPDERLKKKKNISFVRRRRDVHKNLGPGSEPWSAAVLTFGSLFTAPYKGSELYIDIKKVKGDQQMLTLLEKIEFLPFVPEIIAAGKQFAFGTIKDPFVCAQLRLLDGQFKNHWNATFSGLQQKMDLLKQQGSPPVNLFLMTDLPQGNWTGTYLGDLARQSDQFKLYLLGEEDQLVTETAKKLAAAGHGLRYTSSPRNLAPMAESKNLTPSPRLPDVLLYIEETICSCASLGFVGTAGSTIAESIEVMRKFNVCLHPPRTSL